MKGTIRAYGVGGMGTNALLDFYGKPSDVEGTATILPCFIDTSLSNLVTNNKTKVKEEDVYLLEDVDGSGKKRDANYHEMARNIKHILHKFPPAEMNIVVTSASGGTGSSSASLIAKELLENGNTVIMVVVGSEESKIAIENTVKTFQSLDTISRKQGKPLVVSYFHNCAEHPRAKNDLAVRQIITALSILCSRQNAELDTADIANFIGFHNVTSVHHGISFLYLTSKEEEAAKIEYPISVASLFSEVGKVATTLSPEYACTGYVTSKVLEGGDLHFIISQHEVESIYNRLNKRLDGFKESASARTSSLALNGDADDNGIVL